MTTTQIAEIKRQGQQKELISQIQWRLNNIREFCCKASESDCLHFEDRMASIENLIEETRQLHAHIKKEK